MSASQRYFIELSYNGANYHGWQIQKNAVTVQEILNDRLSVVFRQPIETTGCGRTDTGVHARQFFAHFDAQGKFAEPSWFAAFSGTLIRSLNAVLPDDIAIKTIFPVNNEAHARFDASLRSYEYYIHFQKDPFKDGFSWLLRDHPDIELMNQAAQIITEYTDFGCFSRSNTQVKTNNCKISHARWEEIENGIMFRISADRFLRNMVRAVVGTLMQVGRKEMAPEEVRPVIESKSRKNAGTSAPACGLYLTEISYPPEIRTLNVE